MEYEINISEAIRYMGYREPPSEREMQMITDCAEQLKKHITPTWVYRVFPISSSDDGISLGGTSLVLRGRSIREHLEGCGSCVILCATAGAKADELIRLKESEDIALGYMTDCLASAAIEGVCNALELELADKLRGKFLTWRFSPGYGDLPLDIQPQVLNILDAGKRAGVSCTETLLMIPRKTVTAVIGISDEPVSRVRRGCAACEIRDKCTYRKAGDHCGA